MRPHPPAMLQEVKVRMSPADITAVDLQAAATGTSRSAFIRDKVLSAPPTSITTADYHRLVSDACTFMRGDLNSRHVETLVAYVITRLDQHFKKTGTGDQPVA